MSIAARMQSHESEGQPDGVRGDPWLGRVLAERYRIEGHLADGGMGRVYSAIHIALAMPVAIKILESHTVRDPKLAGRFEREAMATASLQHPHIVQVLDWGCLPEGELYLVMELLAGVDLASTLSRGELLGPRRTLRVLWQLALAIDHAHQRGIVHRDLKPENVMMNEAACDFVKVLDFGVARDLKQDTSYTTYGEVVGTPEYMAPEQALGLSDTIGPAADRWALAAIALEMLTGDLPYPSAPVITTLRMIVEAPPRRPGDLGLRVTGLDEVFDRAMARRANARYPTACAFVRSLTHVLEPVITSEVLTRDLSATDGGLSLALIHDGEAKGTRALSCGVLWTHMRTSDTSLLRCGAVALATMALMSSAFAMGWVACLVMAR